MGWMKGGLESGSKAMFRRNISHELSCCQLLDASIVSITCSQASCVLVQIQIRSGKYCTRIVICDTYNNAPPSHRAKWQLGKVDTSNVAPPKLHL